MRVKLRAKSLLSFGDLSPEETLGLLARARQFKAGAGGAPLRGKAVALLFEKPSLRTRVSFEVAMYQLGGHAVYLSQQEVGLGVREPARDIARVLSRWVEGIVCRTFAHANLEELASHATVPVINALSDAEHPCQALADLMTIEEHRGRLAGTVIAFVGDGNNVAASLALGAASVGAVFRIASPQGHELPPGAVAKAQQVARDTGGEVHLMRRPQEAVAGAEVVYTDVWTSMGQEAEAKARRQAFAGYQVNERLLAEASPNAIFLHDMPAHYGEEVPPGFLEHPQSAAYDQAENRLHTAKSLLEALLAP
jgi:ornithine carbamoyltransferase